MRRHLLVGTFLLVSVLAQAAPPRDATAVSSALRDPVSQGLWTLKSIFQTGAKGVVLVNILPGCPKTGHRLKAIKAFAQNARKHGIQVIGVDGSGSDTTEEVANWVQENDLPFPLLLDSQHAWIQPLELDRSNLFLLLGPDLTIHYRGDITNGYGPHGAIARQPKQHYLQDAVDAFLSGQPIVTAETTTDGCLVSAAPKPKDTGVKYCEDVASIFVAKCQTCHHNGGGTPYDFTSYSEVAGMADMIREVVIERRMPPWSADTVNGHNPEGGFVNDRTLTKEEIAKIVAWVDSDAQEGDPARCPPPHLANHDWEIGKPDLILSTGRKFSVPAEGEVDYQYFRTSLPELPVQTLQFQVPEKYKNGVWVSQSEIHPGNRDIVHHAIAHVTGPEETPLNYQALLERAPGLALLYFNIPLHEREAPWPWIQKMAKLGALYDPKTASVLGSFVPGQRLRAFADDSAIFLPANATVTFEMHYTPNGKEAEDFTPPAEGSEGHVTEIGLKLTETPKKAVLTNPLGKLPLFIPAGDPDYTLTNEFTFPEDSQIVFLQPHMHKLGKSVRYDVRFPDGSRRTILNVPRWDYRWQTEYQFRKPFKVPAGSTLVVTAKFDNSVMNPNNQHNPPIQIEWGFSTHKEMMNAWLGYTLDKTLEQMNEVP